MESRSIDLKSIAQKLHSIRMKCGKSINNCAEAIGASNHHYKKIESGEIQPTLPELETLTAFLNISLFEIITDQEKSLTNPDISSSAHLIEIRDSVIGTLLQIEREKKNISLKETSELCAIPRSRLKSYESGSIGIPLDDLLKLANFLSMDVDIFLDLNSPIGIWQQDQQKILSLLTLPTELQDFICSSENKPYLELAQALKSLQPKDMETIVSAIQLIQQNLASKQNTENQ